MPDMTHATVHPAGRVVWLRSPQRVSCLHTYTYLFTVFPTQSVGCCPIIVSTYIVGFGPDPAHDCFPARSGSLVLEDGEMLWPPPISVIPAANTTITVEEKPKKMGPVDLYEPTRKNVIATSAAVAGKNDAAEWCMRDDTHGGAGERH
jgi:hypothetical protein